MIITESLLDDFIEEFLDEAMLPDDGSECWKDLRKASELLLKGYNEVLLTHASKGDINLDMFKAVNSFTVGTLLATGEKQKKHKASRDFAIVLCGYIDYIGNELFESKASSQLA